MWLIFRYLLEYYVTVRNKGKGKPIFLMNFKTNSILIEDVWSLFLVFTSNFSAHVRSKFLEIGRHWGLLDSTATPSSPVGSHATSQSLNDSNVHPGEWSSSLKRIPATEAAQRNDTE